MEAQSGALLIRCTKPISLRLPEILERLYDSFQLNDMSND